MFGLTRAQAIGPTTVELGLWADPRDRATLRDRVVSAGSVEHYLVRVRTVWSEEFTLSVGQAPVIWRGEEALLGVGTPVARLRTAALAEA
jgi:hypothetical protein